MKTVQAMRRIADIRAKREKRFWNNRMKLAKVKKIQDMEYEVSKHPHLISEVELREPLLEKIKEK